MKIEIRQVITCFYCGKEVDITTFGWGYLEDSYFRFVKYFHNECMEENEDVSIA